MNLKDKLIRKLLDTGKKHRILVYPTLALVAVISALSHAVYWGRGNGKKLVASIMVMTMLITQSLFLTSSADVGDMPVSSDTASPTDSIASYDMNTVAASTLGTVVNLYRVDETGQVIKLDGCSIAVPTDGSSTITVPGATELSSYLFGTDETAYVDFTALCTDEGLQNQVSGLLDVSTLTPTAGEYSLFFQATRHSYPLHITDDLNTSAYLVTQLTHDPVTVSIPVNQTVTGCIYPAASHVVGDASTYGLYRYGYTFSGLNYNGTFSTGSTISINTDGTTNYKSIDANSVWSPMEIEVTYDAVPDDAPASIKVANGSADNGEKTFTYYYGENINIISNSEVWASNEAYAVTGWRLAGDATESYVAGQEVNTSLLSEKASDIGTGTNVTGKKYEAIWSYKNIQLSPSSGTVSDDGQSMTIEGTYGDAINCNIKAVYKDEVGTAGTQFEYAIAGTDVLGMYGLGIKTESDGSYTIFGNLSDVAPDGVSIILTITDKNVNDGEDYKVSQHEIKIVSNRREVTISPTSIVDLSGNQPNKVYDGTTALSINGEATASGTINNDKIIVHLSTSAFMDSPNAGTNDLTVTVEGLECTSVTADPAEIADRYTIVTDANNQLTFADRAVVERKPISVEILLQSNQDSSVLFGEKTPDYSLRVTSDNVDKLVGTDATNYSALASESAYMSYMTDILGFSSWNISRSIYSSTGTYTVGAAFVPDGKNYAVTVVNAPTFTVSRDVGVKYDGSNGATANYRFSTEKLSNGYYPGLTITADGTNYNAIRLISSGEGDITVDMSKETAEGKFNSAIVLDDMVNGTITFQMLNTNTGAITEMVTVTGINVDTSAPTLKSFVVSPYLEYFNEFSFGSYFHSQEIDGQMVSSISVKVQYEASGSIPDRLYYYFVDENGVRTDVNVYEKPLTLNDSTNLYEASILIGPTVYGQLVVYATDTTGNMSAESTLKISEQREIIEDYINDGSNSYFEWMIENNVSEAVITAKNLAGEVASVSAGETKIWYNGLSLEVIATDDKEIDSGVNKIEWTIQCADGTSYTVTEKAGDAVASVLNIESYGKIRSYIFTHTIQDSDLPIGYYTISATVYDNAGNKTEIPAVGPYLIDTHGPVITDNTEIGTESYLSGVTFEFTVSDDESETVEDVDGSGVSDVQTVVLYKKDDTGLTELRTWGKLDSYAYNISSNGTYVVKAWDGAGNVAEYERNFAGISDTPPLAPVITIDGTQGRNEWYINSKPYIQIDSTTDIDGIPVVTKFSTEVGNKYIQDSFSNDYYEFELEQQGEILINAWAVSASGVTSIDTATATVKVDLDAPDVSIVDSAVAEDGSMIVSFRATDAVSGVDATRVLLNNLPLEVSVEDGAIAGSFKAYEGETYVITVEDMAGNVSDELEFAPLSLVSYPVTDITTTGAYVEAEVHVGTYPVSDCYVAYKKSTDSEYSVALFNKSETDYGLDINCTFGNLATDTKYDYKIYVKTDVSGEVRTIQGSFKTASKTATAVVYGTAVYDDSVVADYPIYVSLYEANTIIASEKLNDETETSYIFKNVPNGSYRVVATDGYYTKTAAVTIENGGITYPADYADEDGINFVLNGKSTSVVIEDNSINITADELESIYDNALYEGIITKEDEAVVANGGSINVTLHASYMDVSDITDEEMSVFDSKISDNAVIERYIQLYVVKEVRDANGNLVNNTPVLISELYHPITISFPLGDLSGEEIYVASVHGTGSSYVFKDWKNADDVVLSKNFVTITTRYFSVYALYRTIDKPATYTVKWVDGDGKVMKTETVESGKSATPPTETPTKTATDKYTYVFSKWDKDYSSITTDTVISAWFTAHEIEQTEPTEPTNPDTPTEPDKPADSDNPTTQEPSDDTATTEQPAKDADVVTPETQEPQYGYMGSADSPKTGDEAPVVLLVLAMIMSMAGMVVFKKKFQD